MNILKRFEEIKAAKKNGDKVRMLAFGSSNTDRRICGMHWLDCLDLAVKNKYGRIHHCVNSGTGGETSDDLLGRFDTDAGLYRPDIAFLTIGGNDSNSDRDLDAARFEGNLFKLYKRFNDCGCFVIFQTYYAPNKIELSEEEYSSFEKYMEIVAQVAAETNSGLIDHLSFWIPLRERMPEKYLELMLDPFHVNAIGNLVLGLCIADEFGCPLVDSFFDEAESYRKSAVNLRMD